MPSGSRLPSLTMTLRSDPSGFAENTSPLLALRKNKRAVMAFAVVFMIFDLEDITDMSFLRSFTFSSFWQTGWIRTCELTSIPLHERAEASYRLSENQVLHLECSFVGVERFRIGKETAYVVVCGNAITAQKLARPRDRLAALGRGERFGQCGMRIR